MSSTSSRNFEGRKNVNILGTEKLTKENLLGIPTYSDREERRVYDIERLHTM